MKNVTKKIGTLMLAATMVASVQVGTMALSTPETTGMVVAEAATSPISVSVSYNSSAYTIKLKNTSSDDAYVKVNRTAYDANGNVVDYGSDSIDVDAGHTESILCSNKTATKVEVNTIVKQNGTTKSYTKTFRLNR